jgi:hypothetical protein
VQVAHDLDGRVVLLAQLIEALAHLQSFRKVPTIKRSRRIAATARVVD